MKRAKQKQRDAVPRHSHPCRRFETSVSRPGASLPAPGPR